MDQQILTATALIVSAFTLIWNLYDWYKDQDHLKCNSNIFYVKKEDGNKEPVLEITMVNTGNLSVGLRYIELFFTKECRQLQLLGNNYIKLHRSDLYVREFTLKDLIEAAADLEDNPAAIKEIFVVDTTGKRHSINGAKENLIKFFEQVDPEDIREYEEMIGIENTPFY